MDIDPIIKISLLNNNILLLGSVINIPLSVYSEIISLCFSLLGEYLPKEIFSVNKR